MLSFDMLRLFLLFAGLVVALLPAPEAQAQQAQSVAADVKRVVFCAGKVYYDLLAKPVADDIAIVRLEELYPWPHSALSAVLDRYPKATELVWAQEEPKNMGAWSYVAPRLRGSAGNAVVIRYVGRPERASPAEGYPQAHAEEQARIVAEATGPTTRPAGSRRTTGVMRAL